MNKKEMAISFLRLASSGNVREAYEKYVHPVHIFRFEGNQIIEEWEVGQEVPQDSPNEHGVF
jgi:predicted SnoaL-like aldol condensation-catalyzing enzyme